MRYHLYPLGDHAVIIEFGKTISIDIQQKVQIVTAYLEELPPEWMVEYIPAFTTVTILYDPYSVVKLCRYNALPYDYVCQFIEKIVSGLQPNRVIESHITEIPVCYGGEFGPDLETVARVNGLTEEEVIQIHSACEYIVYMIGFAPGFPYIGGMSEKIATPRETPRLKCPERSVGIAGMQTGIYPIETPGGWQLIGRTPVKLFRPEKEPPSLLKAGDKIRFKPISLEQYLELEAEG